MNSILIAFLWIFLLQDFVVKSMKIVPPLNPLRRFSPHPKIWLSEYSTADSFEVYPADYRFRTHYRFDDDYVSRNGSDYIIYEGTVEIAFVCRAKYPVVWILPNPEQALDIQWYLFNTKEIRGSSFPSGSSSPINRVFMTVLTVTSSNVPFLSVNFTCRSVDPKLSHFQSSIYVYKKGLNTIENEGQTIRVPVKSDDSDQPPYYILPCRPALPDVDIILQKQVISPDNVTSWREINPPQKYMTFDPKVGFTLDKRLFGKEMFGLYRCTVNSSYDDFDISENPEMFVMVNVTFEMSNAVDEETDKFKPYTRLKGDASIFVDSTELEYGTYSVHCCSGKQGKVPDTFSAQCTSPGQCEIMKSVSMKRIEIIKKTGTVDKAYIGNTYVGETNNVSNCSTTFFYEGPQILFCEGDNLEYLQFYARVFHPNIQNVEQRVKVGEGEHKVTKLVVLAYYETLANISNLPVEQKALITVGYRDSKKDEHIYSPTSYFLIKDYTRTDTLLRQDSVFRDEIIDIAEYNRNFYFEGEKLIFTCFPLNQFFSHGSYLRLNWENGTATILELDKEHDIQIRFNDNINLDQSGGGSIFSPILGKEVEANLEMKSVDCVLPVWNSTEWEVLSHGLIVHLSSAPKLRMEDEEQIIYLSLHDENQFITFEILGGVPKPDVILMKDGKLIKKKKENVYDMEMNGHSGYNYTVSYNDDEKHGITVNLNESRFIVKITFPVVTHEIQGVYECTAVNLKGNATTKIKVILAGGINYVLPVLLTVLVLGILLLGVGICYKLQHKGVELLRLGISRL